MEITERRRLKEEAAGREVDPKPPEYKQTPVQEDFNPPLLLLAADTPQISKEIEIFVSPVNVRPSQEIRMVLLVFVLSFATSFLMGSFKFPESWVNIVAAKLNTLVVYGSFFVLNIIQGFCTVEGAVLSTHYYKISLQRDLVAFYSLGLLIVLAAFFAFVQRTTWIKKGLIFISLIPLAIVANIVRVLWACGLALNYGTAFADRYFHGGLVDFVFIFNILGLIFFGLLFTPDQEEGGVCRSK